MRRGKSDRGVRVQGAKHPSETTPMRNDDGASSSSLLPPYTAPAPAVPPRRLYSVAGICRLVHHALAAPRRGLLAHGLLFAAPCSSHALTIAERYIGIMI